ncbi:MAG: putative entry exclusion protein TrbK-alt [Rhodobacteraceae bacterium]|nr:putative entry exclusion protein TrbK-alt [Paracoccaceae bacterium]
MDGKALTRIGAIVFVAIAITVAVVDATRKDEAPPDFAMRAPTAVPTVDPLQAELGQCSDAGEAATHDPACLKAWAENRRHFLGEDR